MEALQEFVDDFTYLGFFAVLLLGSLGVPIPEEMRFLTTVNTEDGRHGAACLGLRAAAFLTAGSARVPFWKFVVADAGAALVSVPFAFGLAYFFTDQIKAVMADVHRIERFLGLAGLLALAAVLVVGMWGWHRRVGKERMDQERARRHSPTP